MTSQGILISSRVRVPPSRSLDTVREALALIDTIHVDGHLPLLSVRLSHARLEHGGYHYARDGRPLGLTVSRHASQPHLTLAHEVGHFLDHHALGDAGRFASEVGRIRAVMNAIHQSAALDRIRELQHRRQVVVALPTGRRIAHHVQQRYVAYLLEPKELFARSYAQYVAWSSEHATLRRELLA